MEEGWFLPDSYKKAPGFGSAVFLGQRAALGGIMDASDTVFVLRQENDALKAKIQILEKQLEAALKMVSYSFCMQTALQEIKYFNKFV